MNWAFVVTSKDTQQTTKQTSTQTTKNKMVAISLASPATAASSSTLPTTSSANASSTVTSPPAVSVPATVDPAVQNLVAELIDCVQQLLRQVAPPKPKTLKEQFDEASECIMNGGAWQPTREVVEYDNYKVLRVAVRANNMQCLKAIHELFPITPDMARAKSPGSYYYSDNMMEQAICHKCLDVVKFLIETVGLGVDDVCAPFCGAPVLLGKACEDFQMLTYLMTHLDFPEKDVKYILTLTSPTKLVMYLARPNRLEA
jgi:hypothetical protein